MTTPELEAIRTELAALGRRVEMIEHGAVTVNVAAAAAPAPPLELPAPAAPAEPQGPAAAPLAPPAWLRMPQTKTDWAMLAGKAIAAITLLAVAVRGLVDILRRGISP